MTTDVNTRPRLILLAIALALSAIAPRDARAQACSFTGINGNCTVTIDRLNPNTPPTIYVRHGSQVTVHVTSALPFESLFMDLKSTAEAPPADQFANGFSSLTQALGGLEIIRGPIAAQNLEAQLAETGAEDYKTKCPSTSASMSSTDIEACQAAIDKAFKAYKDALNNWASKGICMVHNLFLPLRSTLATPNQQPQACNQYKIKIEVTIAVPKKMDEWDQWIKAFNDGNSAIRKLPEDLTNRLTVLDGSVADSKSSVTGDQYLKVKTKQTDLHGSFDSYGTLQLKMENLYNAVNSISPGVPTPEFKINELDAHDRNYIVPTWDLNASNQLSEIATRVKADKFLTGVAQQIGTISDAPAKQNIVELKIQFMNQPYFEISAGIVVPIKPSHSYSVQLSQSAATSGGTCPGTPAACGTVVYSPTTTFVPAALFNVPVSNEYARPGLRFAFLLTGVIGYNTANTSAVFGGGPSLSFGSFVLNAPFVWTRNQQLTGGYSVGGSAGTASTPMTKNVWSRSQSLGVSVRVPLGGGGK